MLCLKACKGSLQLSALIRCMPLPQKWSFFMDSRRILCLSERFTNSWPGVLGVQAPPIFPVPASSASKSKTMAGIACCLEFSGCKGSHSCLKGSEVASGQASAGHCECNQELRPIVGWPVNKATDRLGEGGVVIDEELGGCT